MTARTALRTPKSAAAAISNVKKTASVSTRPNETKLSDGHRQRASLEAKGF